MDRCPPFLAAAEDFSNPTTTHGRLSHLGQCNTITLQGAMNDLPLQIERFRKRWKADIVSFPTQQHLVNLEWYNVRYRLQSDSVTRPRCYASMCGGWVTEVARGVIISDGNTPLNPPAPTQAQYNAADSGRQIPAAEFLRLPTQVSGCDNSQSEV